MKAIDFMVSLEESINGEDLVKRVEKIGRTCYKSEDMIASDSAGKFVSKIIALKHESVLEHEKITVRIICDRGVSHEIVRHRIGSYSQESTRYCNYMDDKFGNEITCIIPSFWKDDGEKMQIWADAMEKAEENYFELIKRGATPQEARSVLPNSLKTEIVVTYNLREWRHFFKQRTSKNAHPQIREIAIRILEMFKSTIPIIFDDIHE